MARSNRIRRFSICSLSVLAVFSVVRPLTASPQDSLIDSNGEWESYFRAYRVKGAFLLHDLQRNRTIRYNPDRCEERFIPASTFKIMNAMVGLETAVIPDENYVIPWDSLHRDVTGWNRDHTLRSAMRYSVVWYYQELARRIGRERMQHFIDTVGYGNCNPGGAIDSFWLDGDLRISLNEQLEFLQRLYGGILPFSRRTMDIVKDILVLETTDTYVLRGKTGWAMSGSEQLGWFVGYLEEKGNVYFFGTNIERADPGEDFGVARREITIRILKALGLLSRQ